jgi:hypothetical protein
MPLIPLSDDVTGRNAQVNTRAVAGKIIALLLLFFVSAAADGAPLRQAKVIHLCPGPKCGPYGPCRSRCRIICPDRYSCYPLYGAYGPYSGQGFWGGYTYSGWGFR